MNSNGASSSSNPAATSGTTTAHIITQPASRTLASYHNTRSTQLSSPTSSSSTTTSALHHLPIVKLENAYLTSAGLIKATAQDLSSTNTAHTSSILRASASSSPPPVHTVEEEVGDDTQDMNDDDEDDDDEDMIGDHGGTPTGTRANGNNLSMVSINSANKHRMRNRFKTMLALGGKKAGKGKGSLKWIRRRSLNIERCFRTKESRILHDSRCASTLHLCHADSSGNEARSAGMILAQLSIF